MHDERYFRRIQWLFPHSLVDLQSISIDFLSLSISFSQFQSASIIFNLFQSVWPRSKTHEFIDNRKVGKTTHKLCCCIKERLLRNIRASGGWGEIFGKERAHGQQLACKMGLPCSLSSLLPLSLSLSLSLWPLKTSDVWGERPPTVPRLVLIDIDIYIYRCIYIYIYKNDVALWWSPFWSFFH